MIGATKVSGVNNPKNATTSVSSYSEVRIRIIFLRILVLSPMKHFLPVVQALVISSLLWQCSDRHGLDDQAQYRLDRERLAQRHVSMCVSIQKTLAGKEEAWEALPKHFLPHLRIQCVRRPMIHYNIKTLMLS